MELQQATIPEILEELTRRGCTYSGTANLSSWSDGSKGMFASFALQQLDGDELILPNHPFKGCQVGAKEGQTFYIVATLAPKLNAEPVIKPKSYAWDGKKLAKDELLGDYLVSLDFDFDDAEKGMKRYLLIQSCAELIDGSQAYARFVGFRDKFNDWKSAKRHQDQLDRN